MLTSILFPISFAIIMILFMYILHNKNVALHRLLVSHFNGALPGFWGDGVRFQFNNKTYNLARIGSGDYGSHPCLTKNQDKLLFTAIMPVSARKYYYLGNFPKNHFIYSINGNDYAIIYDRAQEIEKIKKILSNEDIEQALSFVLQKKFSSIIIKDTHHISTSFGIRKQSDVYVKGIPEEVYQNPILLVPYLNAMEKITKEFKDFQ